MAMVVALELHQRVASRKSTRYADCRHRGLGAAVDEAQTLHRREGFADLLGQYGLGFAGDAVAAAALDGLNCTSADGGIVMANDKDSPRHAEVDERIAVDVLDVGTVGPPDEEWRCPHAAQGTHRTVDAAGDHTLRAFKCLSG